MELLCTSINHGLLDLQQAKAPARLKFGGQAAFVWKQCKNVGAKLRKRGTATTADTPGCGKDQLASPIAEGIANTYGEEEEDLAKLFRGQKREKNTHKN